MPVGREIHVPTLGSLGARRVPRPAVGRHPAPGDSRLRDDLLEFDGGYTIRAAPSRNGGAAIGSLLDGVRAEDGRHGAGARMSPRAGARRRKSSRRTAPPRRPTSTSTPAWSAPGASGAGVALVETARRRRQGLQRAAGAPGDRGTWPGSKRSGICRRPSIDERAAEIEADAVRRGPRRHPGHRPRRTHRRVDAANSGRGGRAGGAAPGRRARGARRPAPRTPDVERHHGLRAPERPASCIAVLCVRRPRRPTRSRRGRISWR